MSNKTRTDYETISFRKMEKEREKRGFIYKSAVQLKMFKRFVSIYIYKPPKHLEADSLKVTLEFFAS